MNDRQLSLLEQYDCEVTDTKKGRGAILLNTDRGLLIFKEYRGSGNKLLLQNRLLGQIEECGLIRTEKIIPTKEETLFVTDADQTKYILKTYCEGRECNIYDQKECLEVSGMLALLHEEMVLTMQPQEIYENYSQAKEYEKRNRELKKVRRFLQLKSQKSEFEISLLNCYDMFLEQAYYVQEGYEEYRPYMEKEICDANGRLQAYCHGDFQYHNLLRDDNGWFIMNFEKCMADNAMRDLHLFLRKLLEKSGWNVNLGTQVIEAYEKRQPISALSRIDLYYRLAYPEKFWKIVNFYFNSGKSWIPDKNKEKLTKLVKQEQEKQAFLQEAFRI